jgi:hypothetical protein
MDRLRKEGAALVYRCAKQHSEPTSDKRGAKVDELHQLRSNSGAYAWHGYCIVLGSAGLLPIGWRAK